MSDGMKRAASVGKHPTVISPRSTSLSASAVFENLGVLQQQPCAADEPLARLRERHALGVVAHEDGDPEHLLKLGYGSRDGGLRDLQPAGGFGDVPAVAAAVTYLRSCNEIFI